LGQVLVTRQLPAGGLDPLVVAGHSLVQRPDDTPLAPTELAAAMANGVDGVVCLLTDRIDVPVIDAARRGGVRIIANVAVGYNNIDIAACNAAGILVCNTPGVLDETTADLAFALILSASRLCSEAERDLRAGQWHGWGIGQYLGMDVHGATLGLVGYGRIGQAVARRAAGFGMRVLHHARRDTGFVGFTDSLDEMLAACDVVSLHVPLTDATVHLLDERRLRLLKPTAVVVNTARGPVVDEEALAIALEEGRVFAAGLDVFEHEPTVHPRLLAAARTVLLPHIASASVATRTRMARLASTAVASVLAGRTPANLVTR
jgi:glyoxylate reductase